MRQAASHTANPRVYGVRFIVYGPRFPEHGYGCKHALATKHFRKKYRVFAMLVDADFRTDFQRGYVASRPYLQNAECGHRCLDLKMNKNRQTF